MSKKSNPTLIGAFVVGAVFLLTVGAAIFGGAELLKERRQYLAYFVENTGGLRTGSNVVINGVRVGEVSNIALLVDDKTFHFMTEVTIEIFEDSYIVTKDGVQLARGTDVNASIRQLVDEAGLRATLHVESFITGQLMIEMLLRPDTPATRRGGIDVPYPEVPTIPSRSQELLSKIRKTIAALSDSFDFKEIAARTENILKGVDEIVNSPELRETLAGVNTIVNKEDTQKKILEDVFRKGDRFFNTGDLLTLHPGRWLSFADRVGDTFRWKGENVSTNEVAEILNNLLDRGINLIDTAAGYPGSEEAIGEGVGHRRHLHRVHLLQGLLFQHSTSFLA